MCPFYRQRYVGLDEVSPTRKDTSLEKEKYEGGPRQLIFIKRTVRRVGGEEVRTLQHKVLKSRS